MNSFEASTCACGLSAGLDVTMSSCLMSTDFMQRENTMQAPDCTTLQKYCIYWVLFRWADGRRVVEHLHPCGHCPDLSVCLPVYFYPTCEQDPEMLELLTQIANQKLWTMASTVEVFCLILASHAPLLLQCELESLLMRPCHVRWQDHAIHKEQKHNPKDTAPVILHHLAGLRNSVHKNKEQNHWQGGALSNIVQP